MRRFAILLLVLLTASTAYGQSQTLTVEEVKATSKAVVGGSTLGSGPFRISGIGTADGSNALVIDANGDVTKTSAITLGSSVLTLSPGANLVLSPGGDVEFNPTGNDLLPTTAYDLNIGALSKKYLTLHAAELWVETLVAQQTLATIGGRVLVGPTTSLTTDVSDTVGGGGGSSTLDTGIVAWWSLNESSGTRYEASISGDAATDDLSVNSTVTAVTAKVSNGVNIDYNNPNNYLSAADSADVSANGATTSFTVCGWVKTSASGWTTNVQHDMVGKWVRLGDTHREWLVGTNTTGYMTFWVTPDGGTGATTVSWGSQTTGNTWYHVCAGYDIQSTGTADNIIWISVNAGTKVTLSYTNASGVYDGTSRLHFGDFLSGLELTFDAWGIWDKALSDAEIDELYNSSNGAEYPFSSGGGTDYICVKHNNLANGDRVYMEAGGKVEFMAVTSTATTDHASCNADVTDYYYTVTRNLDGTGANLWYAGDAVFNTGQTGSGFIDLYSVRGVKAASEAGPTIVGNIRNSSTYNDWSPRWAIGNLNGLYGVGATTYGVALGDYAKSNILINDTVGLNIRYGSTVLGAWTPTGDLRVGDETKGNVGIASDGTMYFRYGDGSPATEIKGQINTDGSWWWGNYSGGNYIQYDTSGNLNVKGNLLVGTAAGNLIANATGRTSMTGWQKGWTSFDVAGSGCAWSFGRALGEGYSAWAPPDNAFYGRIASCTSWPTGAYPNMAILTYDSTVAIGVESGKRYEISAYVGNHRNQGAVVGVYWLNAAGTGVAESWSSGASSGGTVHAYSGLINSQAGGTDIDSYDRAWLIITPPDTATQAKIALRQYMYNGTPPVSPDEYLFFTRVYFGRAGDGQLLPSPWQPGAVVADSLSALSANIGSLTIDSTGSIGSGTTTWASGTGLWLGYNSSTYKFRIGNASSGARMKWDGSNLEVVAGNVTINGNGISVASSNTISSSQRYTFSGCNGSGMGYDDDNSYLEVASCGTVVLYANGTDYNFGSGGLFPETGVSPDLGSGGSKWGKFYFTPSTTTNAYYPLVHSSSYEAVAKSNGINGTTDFLVSGGKITICFDYGIAVPCS